MPAVDAEPGDGIKRRLVTVGGERQVNYRRAGSGPPFVLLHGSPRSSLEVIGLLEQLAETFTVIALDTPGYGGSDRLPAPEEPEIRDYAASVVETVDALGLERFGVYGTHTGALLALEVACLLPDRVGAAVLDGLPLFTDDEREEFLARFNPPYPPAISGSHLVELWSRFRDQSVYFPWYRRESSTRLNIDLPSPEWLQDGVLDFLRAGDAYPLAYDAAFRHVAEPSLAALAVPTAILAHDDDPLAPYWQRLPELPDCCSPEHVPSDLAELADWIRAFAEPHLASAAAPAAGRAKPMRGRLSRDYVDTSHGQLLVRQAGGSDGRPLVLLHGSPGSAGMLEPLMQQLASSVPVIAFDTLGNGDSDKPTFNDPWIGDYGAVMVEALDKLGLDELDLYGTHTGGLIAIETAIELGPERGKNVIVEGVPLFSEHEREELLARYAEPLEPRWDGSHRGLRLAVLPLPDAVLALVQHDPRRHSRRRADHAGAAARMGGRAAEGRPQLSARLQRGVCIPDPRAAAEARRPDADRGAAVGPIPREQRASGRACPERNREGSSGRARRSGRCLSRLPARRGLVSHDSRIMLPHTCSRRTIQTVNLLPSE